MTIAPDQERKILPVKWSVKGNSNSRWSSDLDRIDDNCGTALSDLVADDEVTIRRTEERVESGKERSPFGLEDD